LAGESRITGGRPVPQGTLRVLAPRLLRPLPQGAQPRYPRLPSLELILARGTGGDAAAGAAARQISTQFTLEPPDTGAGAVALLGEGGAPADGYWLCADPVHLRVDRDRVMLFGGLSLEQSEADTLAQEFNRMFGADGLHLEVPAPERWYLRSPEPLDSATPPTAELSGRYLDGALQEGRQAAYWRRFQTEMQMLMHMSAVNHAREAAGRVTVSGIWPWGGGYLPSAPPTIWATVISGAPLARGWARLSGGASEIQPRLQQIPAGPVLVVYDALDRALEACDLSAWEQAAEQLEADWLAPALAALKAGRVACIELASDGRLWRLRRRDLYRFWRRTPAWSKHVRAQDA
jgi:hypothetical protein